MLKYLALASAFACALYPTEGSARHRTTPVQCVDTDVMRPTCGMVQPFSGAAAIRVTMRREKPTPNPRPRQARQTASYSAPAQPVNYTRTAAIVSHPSGCPSRAFCGCGAAVRVFGRPVRELWLASNWYKFPRAAPGAGMVAVRRHHVFVLEQHLGGDTWLAYDANSGGHATRVHARSIAGYQIVNPHGAG